MDQFERDNSENVESEFEFKFEDKQAKEVGYFKVLLKLDTFCGRIHSLILIFNSGKFKKARITSKNRFNHESSIAMF